MIRYSVLNVLYAYAYTVRLYSGDIHDLAMETAQVSVLFHSPPGVGNRFICH